MPFRKGVVHSDDIARKAQRTKMINRLERAQAVNKPDVTVLLRNSHKQKQKQKHAVEARYRGPLADKLIPKQNALVRWFA